jgi:[ribosomal protein S18]-alanine N-acetyltransferase
MGYEWKWMMNEAALEIAGWEYEDEVAAFNIADKPEELDEFLNPFNWKYCVAVYEDNELAGFFNYSPGDSGKLELNRFAMSPGLTGKGKGEEFIKFGLHTALSLYNPDEVSVRLPSFHERAVKIFQRLGFVESPSCDKKINGAVFLKLDVRGIK